MNCKSGDRALVWRNCLRDEPCRDLAVGRVIVKVLFAVQTPLYGPVWTYEGPLVRCPKNSACRFPTFLDAELKPLPPEGEVREHDRQHFDIEDALCEEALAGRKVDVRPEAPAE